MHPRGAGDKGRASRCTLGSVTPAGLAVVLLAPGLALAPPPPRPDVAEVERLFARPPDDARIMMRWWWFGPSVSRAEIEAELRRMKDGGIGGFELAVVYPMALDDPGRGLQNERYLSPEFLDEVAFAARTARDLGLRMDVTIGSGWPYGGPYITRERAASRLRSESREVAPTVAALARPSPFEGDRPVAAFVGQGALHEVDPASFRELDLSGEGPIAIPPGDGPRTVVFYLAGQTGQVVKRAALGAEGYVLDHYQRAALEAHLREAGDRLLAAAGPGGVHAVFCDSLEAYDADWTEDLLQEFRRRRGYELRPLLPLLEYEAEQSAAVRRDFGQTLTELYQERFLAPLREWAHGHGVLFRIQNYGVPPASLASSREADLVDGEGWNFRSLTATRWASSAAHLLGKAVVASETWTWLHSPAFRATPLDVKAEADQHFLSGINQLIGHGWPYSPPEAGTPGWPFYAAAVLSDKNPWWPVMPDLAAYLQRVSALLRQGEAVADVALYVPTEDAWSTFKPGTPGYPNLFLKAVEWIGPRVVPAILDSGHGFDLVDDGLLDEARGRGYYKAVVLPAVRSMPEATRRGLAEYARAGGTVLAVRRRPEGEWPSLEVTGEDDLSGRLAAAVPPDLATTPPAPEIGFVHRRLSDGDLYFLANTASAPLAVRARFRDHAPVAESWDPMTGSTERLEAAGGEVALALAPYGSRVVVFRKDAGSSPPAAKARTVAASEELRAGWTVSFGAGETPTPVDLPHSWTADTATRYFSGTASYRRTVRLPASFRAPGMRVSLDLGEGRPIERAALAGGTLRGNSFAALVDAPVREAATVFVNGRRAGSVWAPPYRVDLTRALRDGTNEIRIDVYNTAINRLAEGGHLPDMEALVARYGLRARLQDLDGVQPLPSGLLRAPRIVVER